MRNLILLVVFVMSGLAQADELRIMTWNTYMLPKPIKNSHQKERAPEIANYLNQSGADVIFLQEAFSWNFRSKLKNILKKNYPYRERMKRKLVLRPALMPGLVAYSKYPIKEIDKAYYRKCSGPDCYATKGVQLLEVTLPSGKSIQIANTHMQAGSTEKKAEIRKMQVEQIRDLLQKNKLDGVPQFLVGDLNINAYQGNEFPALLESLEMKPVSEFNLMDEKEDEDRELRLSERIRNFFSAGYLASCLKKGENHNPKLLDHVLMADNGLPIRVLNDEVLDPEFLIKGKSCPMSDHRPRMVTLEL